MRDTSYNISPVGVGVPATSPVGTEHVLAYLARKYLEVRGPGSGLSEALTGFVAFGEEFLRHNDPTLVPGSFGAMDLRLRNGERLAIVGPAPATGQDVSAVSVYTGRA